MKKYTLVIIIMISPFLKIHAQTWQWAKQGGSTSIDHLQDLCTDANGDAYIIGQFGFFNPATSYMMFDSTTVLNNGVNQIYLVKYSSNGSVIWAKDIGGNNANIGASSQYEAAFQIMYDTSTNSLLMTGKFFGAATFGSTTLFGNEDLFLTKIDLSGNFVWAKSIYSNGTSINSSSIVADDLGNIFICGDCNDSAFFGTTSLPAGGFLAKYDSNGNLIWAKKKFIDSYLSYMKIYDNDLIALGNTTNFTAQIDTANYSSNLNFNMFFARFDTSGTIKWIEYPSSSGTVFSTGMDMDSNGNFYIGGGFQNNIDFNGSTLISSSAYDMFYIKYDSNGNLVWLKQANSNNSAYALQVASTSDGNTYVGGVFTGNVTFGAFSISSAVNNDFFITCYNSNGDCIGIRQLTGVSSQPSFRIAVDNSGNCFAAGEFSSQISIGSTTLTPVYANDVFIAKHDMITGVGGGGKIANNQLVIYANPNAGKCNITVPDDFLNEKILTLRIYDSTGNLVQQKSLQMNEDKIKLNLEAEAKGIYNITLSNSKKSYNGKIVFE